MSDKHIVVFVLQLLYSVQ